MQGAALQIVAGVRQAAGSNLPLGFSRKPGVGPAGKSVGFKKTDMTDRRIGVHRDLAVQGKAIPLLVTLGPIGGRLPAARHHCIPAKGQPPLRAAIAAVFNECNKVAVGYRMAGDLESVEPDAVVGRFIVEGEPVASVPDFVQACVHVDPVRRARMHGRQRPLLLVGRLDWIARQQVLNVGKNQFLMLLLVMQTEFNQAGEGCWQSVGVCHGQHAGHGLVDVMAIGQHVPKPGARQQTTFGARMFVAHRVVVGVEEHAVGGIKNTITRLMRCKYKGFKKPCRMRQMPLHRAGVGHGLNGAIFRRERRGKRLTGVADCAVGVGLDRAARRSLRGRR